MRKFTSLFIALFCLFGTAVQAQITDLGDPLITSADQLSSPFSDSAEGTNIGNLIDGEGDTFWHTDWHGEKGNDNGCHYLQIELPNPMSGDFVLWIKRRNADNDHPSKAIITGSVTPDFIGAFEITTLELGNASSGETFTSATWNIPTPVKYLRFTPIECKGTSEGFRTFWHAAEINIYQPTSTAVISAILSDALNRYDAYLWGEDLNIGTEPGQYTNQEAIEEFISILRGISDLSLAIEQGTAELPTAAEASAMVAKLEELMAAYLASKVEYTLKEDGYYRVIANLEYKANVETGEIDQDGNPVTEQVTGIRKTMYSMLEGFGAWHTYDATDCRDIWHLSQNEDGTINMINAATDMGFNTFGNPVTMTADPTLIKFIKIDWAGKENDRDILYFRPEPYNPNDGTYFHQLSHGQGTGTGDKLCTWNGTFTYGEPYESDKGTSEWYLEPVSNEEAQALIADYAAIKNHGQLVIDYKKMLADARDAMNVANEAFRQEYITRNDQFSTCMNELEEGSLNNMLDGDWNTFWHSDWNSGIRPMGTHFLDVTFDEPLVGDVQVWIQRRNTKNNHCVLWNIYGSNDPESLTKCADFEGDSDEDKARWKTQTTETWTLIAEGLATPYDPSVQDLYMPDFNVPEPYKYMRFVAMDTKSQEWGEELKKGYFHLGGIQIYKIIGKAQIATMGEVGETMIAEIEKAETIADEDITLADFQDFESAYNAFIAALKDPRTMRETVKRYLTETDKFIIGEEPGYWTSDAEAKALDAILTEAGDYDKGGVYEQEKLDAYTAAIEAAVQAFWDASIKISTNKWYRFRFPTEESYAKYGWGDGNIRQDAGYSIGDLFGQYVAVADFNNEGENEGNPIIEVKNTQDMREGDWLEFTAEENISNPDAALFRFVSIGDTAYVIQNKATGLYVTATEGWSNNVIMSLEPTIYTVNSVGCGGILMGGSTLAGEDVTNLHAQRWNHRLVTWGSDECWSNSALWVETVADIDDDAANLFLRDYTPGVINPVCVAAGVKVANEGDDLAFYTVAGTFTKDETAYVALNTITETEPGVPFLAIVSTPDDFEEGGKAEPYELAQTFTGYAAEAGSVNGLIGTYATMAAPAGAVVFTDNTAAEAADKVIEEEDGTLTGWTNRTVAANGAYLEFGKQVVDSEGTYDLVIAINGEPNDVAVRNVLDNVAKAGAIYSMDGKLMRKSGNINDVKSLGKGIYILNGAKIYVK